MTERVELEIPLDASFQGVTRLIVGGIAEQASFGFEAMDDLQLAIERLLAETLQDSNGHSGVLTLRRVLSTVVDSFGVEESGDGEIVVRLEKLGTPLS